MDDAQQFSVIAGVIILLACGVVYRGRRGRLLVATSAIGAALGAVAFPRLLGLVMGYRAAIEAIAASPGRSWRTEFHELTAFYTAAPVADTTPRVWRWVYSSGWPSVSIGRAFGASCEGDPSRSTADLTLTRIRPAVGLFQSSVPLLLTPHLRAIAGRLTRIFHGLSERLSLE